MLQLENVRKIYQVKKKEVVALDNINYTFKDIGFYLITGESGSGKSTLLNIISNLEKITSGKIYNQYGLEELAIVFQDNNLLNEYTVYDNLAIYGYVDKDIKKTLKALDILNKIDTKVKYLSGGEKQRVSICRAILKDFRCLVLDEVTSNLDEDNAKYIYELLSKLAKNKLVILVSHDYENILPYCDVFLRLDKGKIVEEKIFNSVEATSSNTVKNSSTKSFSFKWQLKYAFNLFLTKPFLTVLEVLIIIVCLASSFISALYLSFDKFDSLYESLSKRKITNLACNTTLNLDEYDKRSILKGDYLENKLDKYSDNLYYYVNGRVSGIEENIKVYLTNTDKVLVSSSLGSDNEPFTLDIYSNNFSISYEISNYEIINTNSNIDNDFIYLNINDVKSYLINNNVPLNLYAANLEPFFTDDVEEFYYKTVRSTYQMYDDSLVVDGVRPISVEEILVSSNLNLELGDYSYVNRNDTIYKDYYSDVLNMYEVFPEVKITGIVNNTSSIYYISRPKYEEIVNDYFNYLVSGIYLDIENFNDSSLKELINYSLNNGVDFDYSMYYSLNSFNNLFGALIGIFLPITMILFIIFIIFLLYHLNSTIKAKEKEIIIFKAYGIKNQKIITSFMLKEGICVFVSYVIASILAYSLTPVIDTSFGQIERNFTFVHFDFLFSLGILVGIVLFIMIILIIYFKIYNKKEINISLKENR